MDSVFPFSQRLKDFDCRRFGIPQNICRSGRPDFDNASPYTIVSWGEALQQRFDVLLLRCRE